MSRKAAKKTYDLVSKMDSEAEELLLADKNQLSLDTRVAIFAQVAKWVQIRNRIGDGEENEGLLHAYRTTLDAAQGEVAQREADRFKSINDPKRRYLGRNQRAAKGGTADNGGAALDALKSRLPPADVSGSDGHRSGGGGALAVDAGPVRVVRPELPGDAGTEFDEGYSSDEF